jgi:hypothetical protein
VIAETMVLRVPVPWRRAPWVVPVTALERYAAERMRESLASETDPPRSP